MPVRTVFPAVIAEGVTALYEADLKDENGSTLASTDLVSLTLTLYVDDGPKTVINSVSDVNILNADRGTVSAGGHLTIGLLPADNVIVDPTKTKENHIMLIEYTWSGGVKAGRNEAMFTVVNMSRVP